MKKFAITGNPVDKSKSPVLFRAAYHSPSDMTYELMPADSAKEAIELFQQNGLTGMNVTAPFKTDILPFMDEVSDEVNLIGAANTVVRQSNGTLKAYNTDFWGVYNSFVEFDINLQGKKCVLLGIGGAGKAAAYALVKAGADLTIANRTISNAQEFASKINCKVADFKGLEKSITEADIIVNTLYPTIDCVEEAWLNAEQIVFDASYNGSTLLEKAGRKSCPCIDGRYWIVLQAVPAYELFTGKKPDLAAMKRELGIE